MIIERNFRAVAVRSLTLALTLGAASSVQADASPWYIGGDLGQSTFTLDLPSPYSVNTPGASQDRSDVAYALVGGYRLNRYVAFEAGYMDLGKYRISYQDDLRTGSGSIKAHGLSASALWQLPLNDRWSVFLKTGILYSHVKANAEVTRAYESEFSSYQRSEKTVVPILGLGVSFAPTPQWSVRMQYQDMGAARVAKAAGYEAKIRDDVWSLGATYSF